MLNYALGVVTGFLICAWGTDFGPFDALEQLGHAILRFMSVE